MPERKAVARRQARVREMMHTLPPAAQAAILDDLHNNSVGGLDDEVTAQIDAPVLAQNPR
jgi:phospholipid/cholesterol/gamma-HCH transport system ATP-binding protein